MVSQRSFREIFKLSKEYTITEKTLKQFEQYVKGSYLLFKALKQEMRFTYNIEGKEEEFVSRIESRSWQIWQLGFSSGEVGIELSHVGERGSNPFWAKSCDFNSWDREDKNLPDGFDIAHRVYPYFLESVLKPLAYKFMSEYNISSDISFKYGWKRRASVELMRPIKANSPNFQLDLEVYNKEKEKVEFLSSYSISGRMINKKDIWNGPLHPAVEKIINQADKRKYTKRKVVVTKEDIAKKFGTTVDRLVIK